MLFAEVTFNVTEKHILPLLSLIGLDSNFFMFTFSMASRFKTLAREPGLSGNVKSSDVLSLFPAGGSSEPIIKNLVQFSGRSSIPVSIIFRPRLQARAGWAIAAAFIFWLANFAPAAVLSTGTIFTPGSLVLSHMEHCCSA